MTLPYVDEQRIGVLGVCAGGGYAIKAAQIDHRIKAVVGIVPIDLGLSFREGLYGTAPDDVFGILDAVANTRTAEARGAEMAIGGWVADEFNPNDTKEMQSCYSYYKMDGRGKHPRSNSKFPFVNFDRVIAFSSFDDMLAKLLRQPISLVTGDEAGTRWQTEKAYEKASGKKELHYVKGAHHFDLYDHRSGDAVAFVAPFLEQNL